MARQNLNKPSPDMQAMTIKQFQEDAAASKSQENIKSFCDAVDKINPAGYKTWFTQLTVADLFEIRDVLKKK